MRTHHQAAELDALDTDFVRFRAAQGAFADLRRTLGRHSAGGYAERASLVMTAVCAGYRAELAAAGSAGDYRSLVQQIASDAVDNLRLDAWVMDEFDGRDDALEAAFAYTRGQVIPFVQCFVGSDARLVRG